MLKRWSAVGGAAITLALAGYAFDTTITGTAGAKPTAHAAASGSSGMSVNTGAKIQILTPTQSQVVTGNQLNVDVAITHFKVDCRYAGTANRMGIGHYHIMLDGGLINMFCGPKATISLANVPAGKHTLEILAAENDHASDMHSAKMVTFTYKPTHTLTIAAHPFSGSPSIAIVSPKPGATVSGSFNLAVHVQNFIPSCALYGKPNLAGYGHWHAFVDSLNGGMMGMGTMLAMSCANSIPVSLAGIKPGKHTFYAELVDNLHTPSIKGPHVAASVTVTVK
ncbi:MAG TPA: hypothetical protein VMV16_05355 [Solirubrobacteraceae bacterium]|nr:hypothetical protein [Solirubrobacteraceae bacterium]